MMHHCRRKLIKVKNTSSSSKFCKSGGFQKEHSCTNVFAGSINHIGQSLSTCERFGSGWHGGESFFLRSKAVLELTTQNWHLSLVAKL